MAREIEKRAQIQGTTATRTRSGQTNEIAVRKRIVGRAEKASRGRREKVKTKCERTI